MDNQGQMTAKQAAAQARYQEVAKKLHSSAKKQFPSRKITQIKFVQVTTPAGVVPGQRVNLTGAIQDRNLSIVIPTGAREGRQFEVPYILFDDAAEGEDDIFVGDPFFVFPPLLSPAEADEDAVRQLIREAYETDPDNALNPTAWKERGNAEFKQHNYREAVRFYGAAVAAGLETVRAKHPAATNSDAGQAQTELAKQLDVHIAYSNKALALLKLKPPRAEEALQACEAALGIDPTYSKALFRAGQCLEKMGRPGDALAAYTEAQKLKPGDKAISKALAKCKRIVEAREAPSIPNSVPQSTTATGGSKTTNSAVTQKKTPLGQLYSDKQVTKKFDWGPIPANGEYNAGYLESGGGKAANAALMAQFNSGKLSGIGAPADGVAVQFHEADRDASWLDIVEYEFEDHIDKVVVTVDGVFDAGSLPKGRITCQFQETAMTLKIRGVRYAKSPHPEQIVNLRMVCGELWGKIIVDGSGVQAAGDKVVVTLRKNTSVSDRPWDRLEYGKGGSWGAYGT